MSDELNTQQGGGEALPADKQTPAPKNDAEAAAQEQQGQDAAKATADAEAAANQAADEKKRNRTKAYIDRINARVADLERRNRELEGRVPQPQPKKPPQPEDFNFDPSAYAQAVAQYEVEQARGKWAEEHTQQAATQRQQETWAAYEQRAAQFSSDHPDFEEVVGSIQFPLSPEMQAAIAGHQSGPAIAYHLGLNDDDAFLLANVRPELAAAAVERIASRIEAAQQGAGQGGQTPPPAAPPPQQQKPISQAPPPPPTVGGRSPTEAPAEKLTDDEWYARDREQRRKR